MLLANLMLLIAGCFNADPCKVDEYTKVYCEQQQERLDNFATLLEQSPATRAYVLVYGGRKDRFGNNPRRHEGLVRGAAIKDYLVNIRGIESGRVVTLDGGYRETWTVELYVCPANAPTPKPTPTLSVKQIRFRTRKPKREEYIVFCG